MSTNLLISYTLTYSDRGNSSYPASMISLPAGKAAVSRSASCPVSAASASNATRASYKINELLSSYYSYSILQPASISSTEVFNLCSLLNRNCMETECTSRLNRD